LLALGTAHQHLGDADEARVAYQAALDAAAVLGGDPLVARASWALGYLASVAGIASVASAGGVGGDGDEALLERAATVWNACAQPAWAMRVRAFVAARRDAEHGRLLYADALAALEAALGEHPLLVEVFLEAATFAQGTAARELRERAISIAINTLGPVPLAADAWWQHAIAENDIRVLTRARETVRGDALGEALILYTTAAFAERVGDVEKALRLREESLVFRERALGIEAPPLILLGAEIKAGWEALGRLDEAEAFLRRCRDRVAPETWVYRNLTYSIAQMIAGRPADVATLWREFLARREAACGPGSPEVIEAAQIVATHVGVQHEAAKIAEVRAVRDRIADNPDAIDPYLVLAKELTRRGDPRGDLVVIQHCLRTTPDDATLLERERALLAEHRHDLLGLLEDGTVQWHLGFWKRVELDLRYDVEARMLRAVLGHPSAGYLRDLELALAYVEGDYPEQGSNAPAVLGVLAEWHRPTLRSLALIQKGGSDRAGFTWTSGCAHEPARLWSALPNLKHARLGGVSMFHGIAHPRIERLALIDRPLCDEATLDLPALKRLEWTLDGSTLGTAIDVEFSTVDPVWTQPLPTLRELVLAGSFTECGDWLARPEVRARVKQLERLTISASAFEDDPVDALRHHAEALQHLRRLTVTDAEPDPRIGRLQQHLPKLEWRS
jgi:hypothetical protein